MTQDCDTDVLVVGAGPVGTALALELALHGVSFRIIDRLPVRNDKSRALVMQPRTLELLNRHGAADAMISRGRILRGGSAHINRQLVANIDLDDLGTTDTEFPLALNVSQAETEKFLDECLAKYGISVERPVSATNIVQDDTGVTVTLEHPDRKTGTVRARYVVGCDGAHSVVRHAAKNMSFPGAPYPQDFLLCDVRLRDSNIRQDRLNLHFSGKAMLAVFPINHDFVRVVASENEPAKDQPLPNPEEFQANFTRMTPPGSGTLHDPVWFTRFRLHHRCVTQYRDGRLFVAGDAAHIHSPAGGQGMNAGIQDAINLGWKLAHAIALQSQSQSLPPLDPATATAAASALLETYNLERRPVGLALLKGTDRIFSFVAAPPRWLVPLRNMVLRHVLPRVTQSRARRKKMFHFISNFGVSYRGRSNIVADAAGWVGKVRGGDRLVDGRVLVLRAGGDGGDEEGEVGLQRVCGGGGHHLLVFAGEVLGGKGAEDGVEGKWRRVVEVCGRNGVRVKVHYLAWDEGKGRRQREEWYTDVEGRLHDKFGFGRGGGYILVRPDGYVAHIGPLAQVDDLVSFLEGYLVLPVVTPVPPVRTAQSFVKPVVWMVAGACLAVKLLGRFWSRRS